MTNKPCPRCGAPGGGVICSYCGAAMTAYGDDRSELAALDQYHALLDAAKPGTDQCSRLIVEGFVPSGRKALIEAGLRCIARVDVDLPFTACNEQWVKRLEAISTRLRVMAGDEALRAVGEFDAKAKAWRAADAKETKNALAFFGLLAVTLIAIGWWIFRRIFPA
jgi:hypothetical protein